MIRWGVVGTGEIATRFAQAMKVVGDGEIAAVTSRSADPAMACADTHGIGTRYDDYAAPAIDSSIDAVYIASPHFRHEADATIFLRATKHVLCEKPFALDAAQARNVVTAAREHGEFLMKAMRSRFLPSYRTLGDVVRSGRIGDDCPMSITVHTFEGEEVIDCSFEGEGMRFEIAEVHRCFGEGLLESPTMPLDETVAFAAMMDEIRAQIGLVYPVDLPWQPPTRAGSAPHPAPPSSP